MSKQTSVFVFDIRELSLRDLTQLRENVERPVEGGIAERDWLRAVRAVNEVEDEFLRRKEVIQT